MEKGLAVGGGGWGGYSKAFESLSGEERIKKRNETEREMGMIIIRTNVIRAHTHTHTHKKININK